MERVLQIRELVLAPLEVGKGTPLRGGSCQQTLRRHFLDAPKPNVVSKSMQALQIPAVPCVFQAPAMPGVADMVRSMQLEEAVSGEIF